MNEGLMWIKQHVLAGVILMMMTLMIGGGQCAYSDLASEVKGMREDVVSLKVHAEAVDSDLEFIHKDLMDVHSDLEGLHEQVDGMNETLIRIDEQSNGKYIARGE